MRRKERRLQDLQRQLRYGVSPELSFSDDLEFSCRLLQENKKPMLHKLVYPSDSQTIDYFGFRHSREIGMILSISQIKNT